MDAVPGGHRKTYSQEWNQSKEERPQGRFFHAAISCEFMRNNVFLPDARASSIAYQLFDAQFAMSRCTVQGFLYQELFTCCSVNAPFGKL
jgi:hypothetical protein